MTSPTNLPKSDDLDRRLRAVGFAATANDLAAENVDYDEIVHRLRRDAVGVSEPTSSARLGLANEIELTLEVSRLSDALGDLVGRLHRLPAEQRDLVLGDYTARGGITDDMVRRARIVQGIQRVGAVGEYDGEPRDEDVLLFYADAEDEMRAVLSAVLSTEVDHG